MPWLAGARSGAFDMPAPGTLHIAWPLREGRRWHLLAQLDDAPGAPELAQRVAGRIVYPAHPPERPLAAWSVQVSVESA